MEFKRLTTNNPSGNVEQMHNMTMIIDKQVYLNGINGDGPVNLVDYCKEELKRIYDGCDPNDASLKILMRSPVEEFGEYMDDDSLLSLFYWMAVGHAELRARLSEYEDTNLSPDQIESLKELT